MAYKDNSIEAKAEHIFANNPSKDQVFMTATGRAFWSAQALASAGFTLAYTFTRKQLESEKGLAATKTEDGSQPTSNESTDGEKTEEFTSVTVDGKIAPEGKEGTPDESWNVPEIKDWLTEREVKFAHNAKEANLLEKVAEYLNENPENK